MLMFTASVQLKEEVQVLPRKLRHVTCFPCRSSQFVLLHQDDDEHMTAVMKAKLYLEGGKGSNSSVLPTTRVVESAELKAVSTLTKERAAQWQKGHRAALTDPEIEGGVIQVSYSTNFA
jgi:hypothetical protein